MATLSDITSNGMRTANINIAIGLVQFQSPVLGLINAPINLEDTVIIDAVWMNLAMRSHTFKHFNNGSSRGRC